nr:MAG TPA: hypothetical protein [Crassvirales sp.]
MRTRATNTNAAQVQEDVQVQAQAAAQAAANVQEDVQEDVQEVEAANDDTSEPDVISGTITKVMLPEGNDERVSFVLDKEFDTIDFKTGEVKRTNIFGLNIYAVVNQVGQFISYIQLADALAMGKMINPQIISLSMLNAQVTIKRETHRENEQRKNSNELYSRDCITSEFTDVKPNVKPIFEQMLMKIVTTAPAIVKTPAIPNPFGM